MVTASDLGLQDPGDDPEYLNLRVARQRAETQAVRQALAVARGNLSRAAELLGVTRPTLYDLLEKHQIDAAQFREDAVALRLRRLLRRRLLRALRSKEPSIAGAVRAARESARASARAPSSRAAIERFSRPAIEGLGLSRPSGTLPASLQPMRISVFGLGYVGAVSSACMAAGGHVVIGVDKNTTKVDLINRGCSPIIETGVDEIIRTAVDEGRLRATTATADAINDSEISLVCVGTPSEHNGSLKLDFVRKVCEEIGAALKSLGRYHVVVIRSTILPGTMRSLVIPALEQTSGKKADRRLRRLLQPRIPARRHGRQRLLPSAENGGRRVTTRAPATSC